MELCKGKVRVTNFYTANCSYRPWKDGYCKIHHPEERRRRERERMEKKEALYQKANENN